MRDGLVFFTMEGAVNGARALSESDTQTFVVARIADEWLDPASGPWRVLPFDQWTAAVASFDRPRVFCRAGTLSCAP
jgi:hypothetical protein